MDAIDLSVRREVCWDEYLIDSAEGIRVEMHRPEYRGVALKCDQVWEGNTSGYFHVIRDSRKLRLYYRGSDMAVSPDGEWANDLRDRGLLGGRICCAESTDGKTFTRPNLGLISVQGSAENNVIVDGPRDNLCVFKDMNPDCPPEALFKGLAGENQTLVLYTSADGVRFSRVGPILTDGAYDSLNLCFWDVLRKKYFVYYRGVHRPGETESDGKWRDGDNGSSVIRDVRVRTSPDFVHWDAPQRLVFDEGQDDYELYTNQIRPYYRAPQVFLGMPTRYVSRLEDRVNFLDLPGRKSRSDLTRLEGRSGYAMTDCVLMTSRDGLRFRRTDEAFLTPGPESADTWYYGNCYPAWGIAETESDRPGFPRELSIYVPTGYRTSLVTLERWAIRLDGFFSWSCDYKPGTLLTKPFLFGGAAAEVNFASSALGYLRVLLCDETGAPIDGFDSGKLFGDSVSRPLHFAGDLSALVGKPVRMRLEMRDAQLYSFRFNTEADV